MLDSLKQPTFSCNANLGNSFFDFLKTISLGINDKKEHTFYCTHVIKQNEMNHYIKLLLYIAPLVIKASLFYCWAYSRFYAYKHPISSFGKIYTLTRTYTVFIDVMAGLMITITTAWRRLIMQIIMSGSIQILHPCADRVNKPSEYCTLLIYCGNQTRSACKVSKCTIFYSSASWHKSLIKLTY